MKIKLVLDINKTQQAQLNAVVTGRQGDKGTVTVNVFVVDGGVPYNLTGNTIYYEGLKPNNAYVRDTSGVKIINATQGNFEYTFRPETFGVAGIGKRSYFSIEQGGTVRASTQDFGLITLADAMTGNTMSGPYISELEELINLAQWLVDDINSRWTSINTQLTQLQNKLNTMDVVKRSGDTMTGPLSINGAGASTKKLAFQKDGTEVFNLYAFSNTHFGVRDVIGNKNVWEYNTTTGEFNVLTPMRSAGGVFTGQTTFDAPITIRGSAAAWDMRPYASGAYSKGVRHTINTTNNFYAVAPIDETGAANWSNQMALYGNTGVLDVRDLNIRVGANSNVVTKLKDGLATLILTENATNANSGYMPIADRRGNTVTVRMEVTRNVGSASALICTLPVDVRPANTVSMNFLANDGSVVGVNITWDGKVEMYTTGKQTKIVATYVVN
ncbi:BppU family phage baseplate upper protein [Bacillus thuringiensis]|uniref:DUF2479 domain-containing protein n=1 Tax=Bacillus thuringiensis TaxID=1428 RepID=A0A9W3YKZ7_BACTU|nr:BppU family phage baseplate upper protein [Bacillus thuringiensis]AMR06520.1 hypothetical protein AXW78_29910 [Bacillus thuringiensis]AYF85219.1 DUF2479 domain-containing protein [Bacillus thuringiensis]PNK35017.1 DUF2479 domain-containing protein [Bacillus thuringiensis]